MRSITLTSFLHNACVKLAEVACGSLGSIAIGLTFLASCSSNPSSNQEMKIPVVPVFVSEVEVRDVPFYFESIGVLNAAATVEIRPQVNGMLVEVHFFEGETVEKRAPLFTIDPQSYLFKFQEAQAKLAQKVAERNTMRKKIERYNSLTNKELIPEQEWDEIALEVDKSEAQAAEEEARVSSAALDLERCKILAPMSGKVGKVEVNPGNLVCASQESPLATLNQIDPLIVEFTLTEKEVGQLTPDHFRGDCPFEVQTLCGTQEVKGTLTFFNQAYNPQTGLLHVRGCFDNSESRFLPGQSVKVKMPAGIIQQAKLLPQKGVKINQQGPYVYVVKEDNTVEIRQVVLGEEIGNAVIVLEGVVPGEKIVTEGHLRLSPGSKIEIKQQ